MKFVEFNYINITVSFNVDRITKIVKDGNETLLYNRHDKYDRISVPYHEVMNKINLKNV